MAGATDIHGLSDISYGHRGYFRTCTFILAKELTQEAIKEALVEDRTLAFSANNVIGEESLVKALFNASVSMKVLYTNPNGEKTVSLTNTSSIPYTLNRHKKGSGTVLAPFQSITMQVGKGNDLGFWVLNMWSADDDTPNGKHPYINYELAE
jgi:hypothetical protein